MIFEPSTKGEHLEDQWAQESIRSRPGLILREATRGSAFWVG